jgi:hypothetical protein
MSAPRPVVSNPKLVKRSSECPQIDGNTYTTQGNTFELFCDTSYDWTKILSINYTIDFLTCMDQCVAWNVNMAQKCVGVTWAEGQFGPDGAVAGSQCYFYWATTGSVAVPGQRQDSGQLLISPIPSVHPLIGFLTATDNCSSHPGPHRPGMHSPQ